MKSKSSELFASIFGISSVGLVFVIFLCLGGIIGMFLWPYGINT